MVKEMNLMIKSHVCVNEAQDWVRPSIKYMDCKTEELVSRNTRELLQ